jgi:hypothetical protein
MGSLADLGQVDCDLTLAVRSGLDHWFDCLIAFIIHCVRPILLKNSKLQVGHSTGSVRPGAAITGRDLESKKRSLKPRFVASGAWVCGFTS